MHIDPLSSRHVPTDRPAPPRAGGPARPDGPNFRALMSQDRVELSAGIPASPPPEVLDAIDAAARAYQDLHARGRELRFQQDPRSGQLVIEVRDLDGHVLRRIPPTEALAIASGRFH